MSRPFNAYNTEKNGVDRYYAANVEDASIVERRLKEMDAEYMTLEKAVLPLIMMGKLIHPEDIAETILFLASEQARMLTGNVIKVFGGHAL